MTASEKAKALTDLIAEYQRDKNVLRPIDSRIRWLGKAVPLLSFNVMLHQNAVEAADVFARPGFSCSMYGQMESRIILLVRQGITELEHNLTPLDPKMKEHKRYESLWDVAKVITMPQWIIIAGASITIFAMGFRCAQIEFFQSAWDLIKRLK